MGVVAWETEYASPVPAARLFKALVLEPEHHLPKISPDSFESIEILEGDGGPGTIKKVNYVIDGQAVNLKYKIEELDKVNLKTSYTCIESYFPADKVEKICFTMTFVPSEAEGSICKNTGKVYTKADFEFPKEQYIAQGKAHLKSIEEYLLAHSDMEAQSHVGGSICKNTTKIYSKVDFEFPEEQYIAQAKANLKSVEEYLLSHPDVCN